MASSPHRRVRRARLVALPVAVALIVLAAGCGGDDGAGGADATATELAGDAWPGGLTGDLVGGGQIDANALVGRDVVLWFWAPW